MNNIFTTLLYQMEKRHDTVLCTIVADSGSTPRGKGAQMLVGAEGLLCGTGGASGALQKYCGKWVDGVYTPNHTYQNGKCAVCGAVDPSHAHEETETVTKAATCTEAGEKSYTCSICGQTHTEVIPAAGHHYENGVCTGCGQADPAITPDPDPEPEPDPEPTPEPEPVPGGEETQNENDENAA